MGRFFMGISPWGGCRVRSGVERTMTHGNGIVTCADAARDLRLPRDDRVIGGAATHPTYIVIATEPEAEVAIFL